MDYPLLLPYFLACCACACARTDSSGVPAAVDARAFASTDPAQLRVTSGTMTRRSPTRFSVEHPSFRAELGDAPRSAAEIAFTYNGPTAKDAPLASGELRRQIGLKLRAHDTCNVVYAMWHIEPSRGIEVSVKSNPGQSTHEACGDRGYVFVRSRAPAPILPPIRAGERHLLDATITGNVLRVIADGTTAWEGELPAAAFAFDGPAGVRTDNGSFDIELRVPAAAPPAAAP
jgi:hypothetical protein